MKISDSLKIFLLLAGGLILANLLVMNDETALLNEVESNFLIDVHSFIHDSSFADKNALVPVWKTAGSIELFGFSEFNVRALGVITLILSFLGFYFFGKKIFGLHPTLITLLVVGSCVFPVNMVKFISGDAWLFFAQIMSFLFLILYLKQPISKWKYAFWIFVIFGALVHPLSAFIWNFGLWGYLQVVHPKGKNLSKLWLIPMMLVLYFPLWHFGYLQFDAPHFFMGIGSEFSSKYFLLILVGVLPWLGFLPAALWDMFQKLKKKEEMAIINLGWILFGIFSQSLVLIFGLAFIIAKQTIAYFHKNYPYANWVKSVSIINLIGMFCFLVFFITNGSIIFKNLGYRSAIGVSAIFWVMSFCAVLGLFIRSNKLVTGGMAMTGILTALFFWILVNPLLEGQRNLPKLIYQNLEIDASGQLIQLEKNTIFFVDQADSLFNEKNLQSYLNQKEIKLQEFKTIEDISRNKNSKFLLLNEEKAQLFSENSILKNKKGKVIKGGVRYLEPREDYILYYFDD